MMIIPHHGPFSLPATEASARGRTAATSGEDMQPPPAFEEVLAGRRKPCPLPMAPEDEGPEAERIRQPGMAAPDSQHDDHNRFIAVLAQASQDQAAGARHRSGEQHAHASAPKARLRSRGMAASGAAGAGRGDHPRTVQPLPPPPDRAARRPDTDGPSPAASPAFGGMESRGIGSPPADAAQPSPAEQIIAHLRRPVRNMAITASEGSPRQDVRQFRITLQPVALGEVHVHLRMSGGRIMVGIRAERADAAHLLGRDAALLSAALSGPDVLDPGCSIAVAIGSANAMPGGLSPEPGVRHHPDDTGFTAARDERSQEDAAHGRGQRERTQGGSNDATTAGSAGSRDGAGSLLVV